MGDTVMFEVIAPDLSLAPSHNWTSIGAPEGSPYLGINSYVPDFLENWYYGRSYGGGGLWFEFWHDDLYSAYDQDGNWVGVYQETDAQHATRSITGETSIGGDLLGGGNSGTVNLRPLP